MACGIAGVAVGFGECVEAIECAYATGVFIVASVSSVTVPGLSYCVVGG